MFRPTWKTHDKSADTGEIPASNLRREKSRAQRVRAKKIKKMTTEASICMKTNKTMTICLLKKANILRKCVPFCTESTVFCRNRRLFCHYSSVGE